MSPQISVVVPFRNTGGRLAECLDSLAGQTLRDLQVVMVDDGSGDGGAVAKEFAGRDDRFALVQPGPGVPAGDAGVEQAEAPYLAFADGEDALPPYACELLVGTLEATGSDIAGGDVLCLDGERVWRSPLHAGPYARTVKSTHVTRHTSLLQDRTLWNKVYRRSFWDEHRFHLEAGQDMLVAVQAHVLASAVDVLDVPVYFWRDRPATEPRSRPGACDITDRMAILAAMRRFVREHAPELLHVHDRCVLDLDVRELMLALPGATWEDRERLVELGAEVVAGAARSATQGLDAIRRLQLHLLSEHMVPELLEVLRFEAGGLQDVPLMPKGRLRQRWYALYPFFADPERGIPDDVYDVTDEIALEAEVDRVEWDVDTLIVEGHAHFDRFDVSSLNDSRIRVWMRDARTGKEIRLRAERARRPDVTADSGQRNVSFDWSGFVVRVEPEYLLDGDEWRTATYELYAEVTTSGHKAVQRLTAAAPAVRWTAARQVDEHVAVQPAAGDDDVFVVHVKRAKAVLTGVRRDGDVLELTGWTRRALGAGAALVATRRHGGAEVRGKVTLRQSAVLRMAEGTGFDFTATLPVADLVSVPDGGRYRAHLRDVVDWDVRLTGEGGPVRLTVASNVKAVRYAPRGREVVLTRTAFGNLRVVERSPRPVVTAAEWDAEGRLTLRGDCVEQRDGKRDRPGHLVLRRRRTGDEHRVPLDWDDDGFTAAFSPERMPVFGNDLPLAGGTWDVVARTRSGEVAVVAEREAIPGLVGRRRVDMHEFEIGVHQVDALCLHSRPALEDDERGGHAQVLIQQRDYPVYLRSPLSDLVVFDSHDGAQYSCNPRAIYAELVRRGRDMDCVWVTQDGQFTVEGKARTVLAGSREHYRVLARARHIITNHGLPYWYQKRRGQTYVQTWHGTPLKRIGHDLRPDDPEPVQWEVSRWDLLLSPSPYATEIMRRAFKYEGEVLETGLPRNDVLSSPDWEDTGARIRKSLGIPDGKKAVLYAPTWRDDHVHGPGRYGLPPKPDMEIMRHVLGEDHVLLLRAHRLITDRDRVPADDFVMDVSRYPDITDLYLAADVLVTDYSSAMFDYAVLGRPVILYTYDLERYRELRGLYIDLEAEAPGPVVRTSAQLAEAVKAAPGTEDDYADAYDRFFVKYCPHEDGQAAARAVDRIFGDPEPA